MVQSRSNEIEPHHPGKTPPCSGLSTRKEWGISTFSLQTILTTKEVTYFSAWALYLYTLTSKSTNLCFIHICEVTEALEFPCCTSGSHSLTFTCCSSGKERTSRDKQGGESFQNLGAEGFLQLKDFSYQPHFQQSALATALCGSS